MMRFIITLLIFNLIVSCDNNKLSKPDNLIPKHQMVDVIVDFTLLSSGLGLDRSILKKEGIVPEDYVYKKYAIDSAQFAMSNEYYAHDVDDYQDIYAKVKVKLNSKKEVYKKLSEKETKEKKKKDSLRLAEKKKKKSSVIEANMSKNLKTISIPVKISDSLLEPIQQ